MGLLDDIGSEQATLNPNMCPVARLLPELDDADAEDFKEAISDPGIAHVAVTRALKKRGIHLDTQGLSRHRRHLCACTS